MNIELRQLSPNDGRDIYDMLQLIDAEEYGFTNEVNGMPFNEYEDWLKRQDDWSRGENLPEDWIPQTTYFLYADGIPVGIGRIRHRSSEALEARGVGNVGYGIAKPHRGKGYGNTLWDLLLRECPKFGYVKIKSFVYIDNTASNKALLKYGAKLIGTLGKKNTYEVPAADRQ